jgi:hypothetical protein
MKKLSAVELIQNFDKLPDDAIVPDVVARLVLNVTERTWRRKPNYIDSKIPKVELSPQRWGRRAGNIRAFARGELATA